MGDTKRLVVEGILEGGLFIAKKDGELPMMRGTVALTSYAMMEQDRSPRAWASRIIYLGLEISIKTDAAYVAWQEIEAFVRALAIQKNVSIAVQITRVTDKPEEWPKGIGFLSVGDLPQCPENWQPSDHHHDPKNRVTLSPLRSGGRGIETVAGIVLNLEKRHKDFSGHNEYQSELVKDYIAGLDVYFANRALAMLYFFKVLERIGKKEYGNPPNRVMNDKTLRAIITNLNTDLTAEDKECLKTLNLVWRQWQHAKSEADLFTDGQLNTRELASILRWRHTKSEAHLVTEGQPDILELAVCTTVARLAILKRV